MPGQGGQVPTATEATQRQGDGGREPGAGFKRGPPPTELERPRTRGVDCSFRSLCSLKREGSVARTPLAWDTSLAGAPGRL